MKIQKLIQTSSSCPSQWEFTTDNNRPVYVHYRWGYLSVCVGEPNTDIESAVTGIEIYREQIDRSGRDAEIDWKEVEEKVKDIDVEEQIETAFSIAFKEIEVVRLKEDLPEHNLKKGETGTIVMVYPKSKSYYVEFVERDGTTKALVELWRNQIEPTER